jgi:hypothetical protein
MVEIRQVRIPDILAVGDLVNIRVHFPTGQDYTVVSDKAVMHINTEMESFFIEMNEEEILAYSSAKEDVRLYQGTEIYITQETKGLIQVDKEYIDIAELMRQGLDYDFYPLNPNALALSALYQKRIELMEQRLQLDDSLSEFFDQDAFLFSYVIDPSLVETIEAEAAMKVDMESDQNSLDESLSGSNNQGESDSDSDTLIENTTNQASQNTSLNSSTSMNANTGNNESTSNANMNDKNNVDTGKGSDKSNDKAADDVNQTDKTEETIPVEFDF